MSAHNYELMFIADPELDENGLKKLTNQHMEIVTKEGGSVASSLTRLMARPRATTSS